MRRALYFTWKASIYAKYRGNQPKNKHNYSLPGNVVCVLNIEENTQQIKKMITYIFMYICLYFKPRSLSSTCLEWLEIFNGVLTEILVFQLSRDVAGSNPKQA